MRLFSVSLASLLVAVGYASQKDGLHSFDKLYPQSLSETPIKLNDESYSRYTSKPRDYAVIVLLTALENRFNCALCQTFQPDWELLAKSWTKGDTNRETRLIFGTLDFIDGRNAFQAVSLLLGGLKEPFSI